MGRHFRMSPSWKPNTHDEQPELEMIGSETEKHLHQFIKKKPRWKVLHKQIDGEENLSKTCIQKTVEEDELEISEEE